MPTAKRATAKSAAKKAPASKSAASKPARAPAARISLAEVMKTLEKNGSEQTRKTYLRHGAKGPMFGVSFATMKELVKKIGVDQELARKLFETGYHDARMLALKIADPAQMTSAELDRWAGELTMRMCCGYVAMLAAEGPHGAAKAVEWLAPGSPRRSMGWVLAGHLAQLDPTTPDSHFLARLAEIEKTIHAAPNADKEAMNMAVIQIGCRNAALRKAATAAAKRIGKLEVDHGDTACKTPDAAQYIDKCWAHSTSKGFESPAAQERSREPMRTRC
jgi:3-methyladenine DNA glycosylase AlkD